MLTHGVPSRAVDIPLAAAAASMSATLLKGVIVTAESVNGDVRFSSVGELGMQGVPPEAVIFEIGSITKVFTALVLAIAVEEHKVTLDTTVAEILGHTQHFADPNVGRITLRQLATHSSGLPRIPDNLRVVGDEADPYAKYDRNKISEYLASARLKAPLPAPHEYSNLGVGLLGDLLARAYGRSWESLIRAKITGPLGLRDTVAHLTREQDARLAPPYAGDRSVSSWTSDVLSGAGVLRSTARDLVKFGAALASPETSPFPSALATVLMPQSPDGSMGLAIFRNEVDGQLAYEHAGGTGGYRTFLQVIPAKKIVRVVLIDNASVAAEAVLAKVRTEESGSHEESRLSLEQLSGYQGVYELDRTARFTAVLKGDDLMVQLTGQAFLPVFAEQRRDRFFYRAVNAELQFERNDGALVGLTLYQGGRVFHARKADVPLPRIVFRPAAELQEFVGVYRLANDRSLTISVDDDTLFGRLDGYPTTAVFETAKDRFAADATPATVEFVRDEQGHVAGVALTLAGQTEQGRKE